MEKLQLCGEPDCKGIGVCPCRDWTGMAEDRDDLAEKYYWQFDALRSGYPPFNGKMENGSERLAFKSIVKNILKDHADNH